MVCGSYGGGETGLSQPFKKGMRRGSVDGIDVIELNLEYANRDAFLKRAFNFFRYAFKTAYISMTESYDVVFATTTPLTVALPAILARWMRKKPFVFEVRDLWPELPKAMGVIRNPLVLGAMSALEWAAYHSAHRCIGLSPGIVKGIEARGIKPQNITMIPNGCDLNIFNSAQSQWRPEGVLESDLMAVFTGTHGIANGLDSVLAAASILQLKGRQDIKLVLVGQGKLKPELEQLAQEKKLRNVIFLDPVNKSRLAELMAGADIGMQTLANIPAFYYGTSPNKFFDYIAAGVPVLNNYPGWIADLINEAECGFAVSPDDPEAFADALIYASQNRQELINMGQKAVTLAESFSRPRLGSEFSEWLEAVVV